MIASAAIDGITLANQEYERLTGGWWITDDGVERFVSCVMVETLREKLLGERTVVPEVQFNDAEIGRIIQPDIVIYEGHDPIYPIEIKRNWQLGGFIEDIGNIMDLIGQYGIHNGGSMEGGISIFFIQAHGETNSLALTNLQQTKRNIRFAVQEHVQEAADGLGLIMSFEYGGVQTYPRIYRERFDIGYWAGRAFSVELKYADG